jgi:hypothetical protein
MTLPLPAESVEQLKRTARLRERLARAGLLAPLEGARTRPDAGRVAAARAAAGRGRPLSDLVDEGRGERY